MPALGVHGARRWRQLSRQNQVVFVERLIAALLLVVCAVEKKPKCARLWEEAMGQSDQVVTVRGQPRLYCKDIFFFFLPPLPCSQRTCVYGFV